MNHDSSLHDRLLASDQAEQHEKDIIERPLLRTQPAASIQPQDVERTPPALEALQAYRSLGPLGKCSCWAGGLLVFLDLLTLAVFAATAGQVFMLKPGAWADLRKYLSGQDLDDLLDLLVLAGTAALGCAALSAFAVLWVLRRVQPQYDGAIWRRRGIFEGRRDLEAAPPVPRGGNWTRSSVNA